MWGLDPIEQSGVAWGYPKPTTWQTLGKLAGAKVISKLDANSSFWQRKLKDSSKLLTTFITPRLRKRPLPLLGFWEIGRLPFWKTVPCRNQWQASGSNPWFKELGRNVTTAPTTPYSSVKIQLYSVPRSWQEPDYCWHAIKSTFGAAGWSVQYWRGNRFIRSTCILPPFQPQTHSLSK